MDKLEKMKLLAHAAQYDLCAACGTQASRVRDEIGRWLYPAVLPNGRTVSLLKVLQSNACENDCFYCSSRRSRDGPRLTLAPEELAWCFDQLVRTGRAQGLFLSSAVCHSAQRTMAAMIATVELVRFKYGFPGYVHLKLLPGSEPAAIERAVQLADRVSVNLEAPNPQRLQRLSADKRFAQDLLQPMQCAKRFRDQQLGARAGLTTQFVVGPAGESDEEILHTVDSLYRQVGLTRAYFSAFQPVPNTPLEHLRATPPLREHRLYQSDFLFRYYGFALSDLAFDESGALLDGADPKMVWAQRHPEYFPIEINCASREQLLRIPGIGPRSAGRILQLRREGKMHCLEDLRAVGAVAPRAAPFILLNGRRPPQQLPLW
jgi:predicted DNA-binding helix-hairpin-helix protein